MQTSIKQNGAGMKRLLAALVLGSGLATGGAAQALTLVSATAGPGQSARADIVDGAVPEVQSAIGFSRPGAIALQFELASGEAGGLLAFDAIVSTLSGFELAALEMRLDRGTFAFVGSVEAAFAQLASLDGTDNRQSLAFQPAERFGVDLGDTIGRPGARDWLIAMNGLAAGDRFTLTVSAVPEPAMAGTMAAGLAVLAVALRRRERTR